MRVAVVGAGVGGLAAGIRLAHAGHRVTVLEMGAAPGGKCGRVQSGAYTWDSGPSLLTLPGVFRDLFAATGGSLEDELELLRVEPVTRYRFADGSQVELSADLPTAFAALEAWSPGAGADWTRFLGVGASMWRASVPFLTGPPPWPPRRPVAGAPAPDPRDLLRVRPWSTLRGLARATVRDPRLRMIIERFATYAGADPRRAPAALAVAGWVEHAFGAWQPRGGMYELVQALARRLDALGGELRLNTPVERVLVRGGRVRGITTAAGALAADAIVADVDPTPLTKGARPLYVRRGPRNGPEPSLSGLALMLGLRGRDLGRAHHEITFPADYDAEFDDVFVRRRPVRDPTVYVSAPWVTDAGDAPADRESLFVLVNAPSVGAAADWDAAQAALLARLDLGARIEAVVRRGPAELEHETGAAGGAIYGVAPHGRLGTLRRPGQRVRGVRGLWRVGGTAHPGGGLPLVALGAATVAREIGRG
jgi:phytoene desaturase